MEIIFRHRHITVCHGYIRLVVKEIISLYFCVFRTSKILVCGYDAPETVGSPTLAVKDSKATITWTAPKKGKYSDFGSTFDASDITYKVVRNNDGKVIADGITATTAEDSELGDEIQTYSYTIYATSHGETGIGALTNSVTAGKYLHLPYTNDFSAADCLNGHTILNLDNNGSYRTWSWNNYYKTLTSGWGTADDWLITPTFSLTSDRLYAFRYKLSGNGHLRTTVGIGNTADAQDKVLNDLNGYTTSDYETKEFYFRLAENGLYNFGLYNYNLDEESWNVDNLTVMEIATATAPDKVRSLNITAAQKEYIYSAEVMYDGDENEDNNSSTEVEINPTQIALPAPTNLTLSGNEDLSWMAPETMDGREVILDFEDVPAFTTDNINGWKTVDRDGHITLTFVQYYGNYWPYANQPLAWMTWKREGGRMS